MRLLLRLDGQDDDDDDSIRSWKSSMPWFVLDTRISIVATIVGGGVE